MIIRDRLDPIINKANKKKRGHSLVLKKGCEENELKWPCVAPFAVTSDDESYGIVSEQPKEWKPVAHIVVPEANRSQMKQVGERDEMRCRLSMISLKSRDCFLVDYQVSFEKCRVIVRNLPFTVGLEEIYERR